jgi:cell division septal protein FtsQ|tara:strand:+ start:1008 stop:2117 length:1110 start_codon:yes stop_codon:yes gene_type:complete
MWRGNRKRNRRGRKHTLINVVLPIQKVRQQRVRSATKAIGFLLGVVALFFVMWRGGEWLVQVGFNQNEQFSIRVIDVRTNGVIDPAQIRRWAGPQKGDNLFQLDLMRVKRDLEMVPLIESVAVDRELPHTLRIRVLERKPVAQVVLYTQNANGNLERNIFWVDEHGFVMEPLALNRSEKWLPVLVGINQDDLMAGRSIKSSQVSAALQLISRFDLSSMAGLAHMRHIDVTGRETMRVTTWQGATVRLHLLGLDRQLARWRQIHDLGRKHNRAIATLDLSIKNNLPVRWMIAPSTTIRPTEVQLFKGVSVMSLSPPINGQKSGPCSFDQLRVWLEDRQVAPETPVYYYDLTNEMTSNELVVLGAPAARRK